MNSVKELICYQLLKLLDSRIEEAKKAIETAKESRDNETKSSVGDKYETGRAMMQLEMNKHQVQLSNAEKLKVQLAGINLIEKHSQVKPGSLVFTNQGNYFISIGIGHIEVEGEKYYAISLASPIGKLLQGKSIGDIVSFKEKEITITDLV